MRSTDQIRVLHLVGGKLLQGGTASVVRDLVAASDSSIANSIWVHRDCPEERDLLLVREGSSQVVNASIWGDLIGAVRDLRRLLRTIKQLGTGILHAHTRAGIFAGWLAHRFTGLPLIIHLHFLARHTWLYRFLIKTSGATAIYNSRRTAQHFSADLKTATIVNPTIQWPPTESLKESREPRIVAASALLPHKHLDVIVDASTLLADKGMIVETRIYGKTLNCQGAAYERGIIRACSGKPFITLDEWTRHWVRNLCTNDIFVHLGEPESFGLVMLEAFARGLRLVVLKETFLQELPGSLSSDGIYRSEDLSPVSVANAIQRALQSEVDGFSLYQRRSAIALKFSEGAAAEKVSSVYRTLDWGSL